MTLIVEAEKELILVSPYVNNNHWEKMKRSLQIALNKDIDIQFFLRENADNEISALKNLGIYPISIKDLHAKVYINDKYAIVTSQNIIEYSDINSIEVGYITETEEERIELINFVNTYIGKLKYPKLIKDTTIENSVYQTNKIDEVNNVISEENNPLSSDDLQKLIYCFKEKYRQNKFTLTKSYLYCDSIIQFGYFIMVEKKYTVKINSEIYDDFNFMEAIRYLPLQLYHTFKIQIHKRNNNAIYLDFIPISETIDFENLIKDYLMLTELLINDDVLRKIKLKTNHMIM